MPTIRATAFSTSRKLIGRRKARQAWEAWRRAALDFAAVIRRLDLKCDFEPRGSLLVATTPEQASRLTREQKTRRDAGLDAVVVKTKAIEDETAIAGSLGVRFRDGATINPYRATLGFASAAAERGALIFERSPVRKIGFNRKDAEVFTRWRFVSDAPRRDCDRHADVELFGSLARHFWFKSAYLALTDPFPRKSAIAWASVRPSFATPPTPPHVVRWVDDERLLIAGADGRRVRPIVCRRRRSCSGPAS